VGTLVANEVKENLSHKFVGGTRHSVGWGGAVAPVPLPSYVSLRSLRGDRKVTSLFKLSEAEILHATAAKLLMQDRTQVAGVAYNDL